ncbi:hypothetical protein DL95DRAFT_426057 [Leptodontidium sp. 2 PMI_412]|nr:hypothetical protein DL95DRAFT_426057 [Leptodontidium sp. 2 PMI_412]
MALSNLWQKVVQEKVAVATHHDNSSGTVYRDGDVEYTREAGAGNNSKPSYQEASGAPVEKESPLGYQIRWFTVIFLNIGQMIGTGVFSTPGRIFQNLGSLASYFPNRSGADDVYLEQAYPRPKYFFPTAFAVLDVLLAFSSSNSIVVLSTYLFRITDHEPTEWEAKGVAIAGHTVATIFSILSTKYSLYFSNSIGIVKVLTLVIISITGFVVLGNQLAYEGYANAFNMVNEVKDPIKTIRWAGSASLLLIAALIIFPKEEMRTASTAATSLFFRNVFGGSGAARGLNVLILLSAFGNLISNLIGSSRIIRECGRQGPFGTPLGPYALKYTLTLLMIVAPPFGDAFDFVVDLEELPRCRFYLFMATDLYIIPWDVAVIFWILVQVFLLVMPWYPPPRGRYGGRVSFWYAEYCVTGIGILVACGIYYVLVLDNGATTHKLVNVRLAQLEEWDRTHDVTGKVISGGSRGSGNCLNVLGFWIRTATGAPITLT